MEYDYDKLRKDLIDYYGTASTYNPMAIINIKEVENASLDELVRIAGRENFNIYAYIIGKTYKNIKIK